MGAGVGMGMGLGKGMGSGHGHGHGHVGMGMEMDMDMGTAHIIGVRAGGEQMARPHLYYLRVCAQVVWAGIHMLARPSDR